MTTDKTATINNVDEFHVTYAGCGSHQMELTITSYFNHDSLAASLRAAADELSPVVDEIHPLVKAYHAIFDAKDKLPPGGPGFVTAYESLRYLASLIESLGYKVPERFDAPRPTKGD